MDLARDAMVGEHEGPDSPMITLCVRRKLIVTTAILVLDFLAVTGKRHAA